MPTIKESIVPTLIVIFASALVILASLPLAQTEFAAGVRVDGTEQVAEGGEGADGEVPDLGVVIYIAPLIKVALLMGIGAVLTMGIWRAISVGHRLFGGATKPSG